MVLPKLSVDIIAEGNGLPLETIPKFVPPDLQNHRAAAGTAVKSVMAACHDGFYPPLR